MEDAVRTTGWSTDGRLATADDAALVAACAQRAYPYSGCRFCVAIKQVVQRCIAYCMKPSRDSF